MSSGLGLCGPCPSSCAPGAAGHEATHSLPGSCQGPLLGSRALGPGSDLGLGCRGLALSSWQRKSHLGAVAAAGSVGRDLAWQPCLGFWTWRRAGAGLGQLLGVWRVGRPWAGVTPLLLCRRWVQWALRPDGLGPPQEPLRGCDDAAGAPWPRWGATQLSGSVEGPRSSLPTHSERGGAHRPARSLQGHHQPATLVNTFPSQREGSLRRWDRAPQGAVLGVPP